MGKGQRDGVVGLNLYTATLHRHLEEKAGTRLSRPPGVFVGISGATAGYEAGFTCVHSLRKKGYDCTAVATEAAFRIYGRESLLSLGGFSEVFSAADFGGPDRVREFQAVYLPVVTGNLVGKLAAGIYDSFMPALVCHALMAGIPVIGNCDGAMPEHPEFLRRGYGQGPQALRELWQENLAKVRRQTVVMVPSAQVPQKLAELFPCLVKSEKEPGGNNARRLDKRVITLEDVKDWDQAVLEVSAGVIFTDLAREHLAKAKIRVEQGA